MPSRNECVVCGRVGALAVLFPNSHGDWLCGACSEWHFLYLLASDLQRPIEDARFEITLDGPNLEYEPWELPGYVPEDAVPL